MKVFNLSQKTSVVKSAGDQENVTSPTMAELEGSLGSVARIAAKEGLTNISLYTDQGCLAKILATLNNDTGIEAVKRICEKIERVTCLKSLPSQTNTDKEIEIRFTQPGIWSNVTSKQITEIPPNAKGVVEFFRSHSLPVILLILDNEGCPTKISIPLSREEVISEFHELDLFFKTENYVRENIEKETGYNIREVYTKGANPGVPFDTANFVLDKPKIQLPQ